MTRLIDPLREILSRKGLAWGTALAGGVLYFILALGDASSRESFLDEGLYLYKGWLFISGRYTPFQDYGLWTNHMPYSYLIAGIVQYLFGPSLQVGRIFSILLSLAALLGLWLLARRLSNGWLAAAVIWAMALNTAEIKIYTIAISQSLIACLMVWALVLTVGEKRANWQIGLGALLASLMLMARINMTIVLPLLVVYVFWQHGRTAGIVAVAAGGLGVVLGHALFWPDILKLWAAWLPRSITPFLDGFRLFTDGVPYQTYEPTGMGFWQERLLYFWMSIRLHPAAFMAAITAWLLWPASPTFRSSANFKPAVFLTVLLGALWGMHAYAALGPRSFCVSCMIMYVGFFDYLGFVVLAGVFAGLRFELSPLRKIAIAAAVLVLTTGVLYSASEDLKHFTTAVMRTEVPRVKSLQILPETIELRVLLHNKFQLPEEAGATIPSSRRSRAYCSGPRCFWPAWPAARSAVHGHPLRSSPYRRWRRPA